MGGYFFSSLFQDFSRTSSSTPSDCSVRQQDHCLSKYPPCTFACYSSSFPKIIVLFGFGLSFFFCLHFLRVLFFQFRSDPIRFVPFLLSRYPFVGPGQTLNRMKTKSARLGGTQ